MYIKNSDLLALAFTTAFFARVFHALGVPAIVDFLHLATVPFACGVTLLTTQTKNRSQISISYSILFGLFLLLTVIVASAVLNSAGVINIVFDFLLLAEPFLLLLAVISVPMSLETTEQFRTRVFSLALANIFFAHMQRFVWRLDRFGVGYDNIKGIFIAQGAGHYVGAAVALTFGVYYYITTVKTRPAWVRVAILVASISQVIISGRRQTFLAFILALLLSVLTNLKQLKKAILYLLATVAAIIFLYVAAQTVFPDLFDWGRPDILAELIHLKTSGFRIIPSYYQSPLNLLLGIGPGHSIGRLGGWMLQPEGYWPLLHPLGATRSSASDDVWKAVGASWLGDKSTFFSPLFSWAGIWGDLGFLGLGAYFYLSSLVWRHLCTDNVSKYFMFTILFFGCFFTWLEEPAYMLFLAILIGLQWQVNSKTA